MSNPSRVGRALTTTVYFSSLAIIGLIYGISGPTLGALAAQAGVGLGSIGIILSARSLGYLLGASQLGRFVDRRGSHRFVSLTILIGALVLALIPVARHLWVLALLMGLSGISLAGPDVGGNTLILRLHKDNPGPYMNGLHLFFGLGALFAPLLVAWTRTDSSVAWPYWILAALVATLGLLFLLRPEPPLPTSSTTTERDGSVRGILWLGCIMFVFYVGAEVGFANWLFEYVHDAAPESMATQITSGFWFAFTSFRLVGILLATRVSPVRILGVSLMTGIGACVLLFVLPSTAAVLWVGALLFGAGVAAVYPTFLIFMGRQMQLTGRRIGIIAVASTIGSMSIPWIVGRVFAAWSPRAVPLIAGICLLLSLATLARIGRGRIACQAAQKEEPYA